MPLHVKTQVLGEKIFLNEKKICANVEMGSLHRLPQLLIVRVILTRWRAFKLSVTLYTKVNCDRSRRSITDDAQSQFLLSVTSPCSVDTAAIQ